MQLWIVLIVKTTHVQSAAGWHCNNKQSGFSATKCIQSDWSNECRTAGSACRRQQQEPEGGSCSPADKSRPAGPEQRHHARRWFWDASERRRSSEHHRGNSFPHDFIVSLIDGGSDGMETPSTIGNSFHSTPYNNKQLQVS